MKSKDVRLEILGRAALAEQIEIQPNGWGLNTCVGIQGEWISPTLIDEWERRGFIEMDDGTVGTITAKGQRATREDEAD